MKKDTHQTGALSISRPEKVIPMYQVRQVCISKTPQLDALAHECGQLYSQTLVFFWRIVCHVVGAMAPPPHWPIPVAISIPRPWSFLIVITHLNFLRR